VEVTITDKTGAKNNAKCYHRFGGTDPVDPTRVVGHDPDRMYALLNDKDFVLVQFFQFDKVLRNPASFLPTP
jgi:hypothetical protein